ncbi:MAG: hypothetical protein DRJ01_02115 [Bacteroidetes bacterium]|nr:MAG: hypothetical protein DRJ01_02115 [Bacteroidota bacterium]
MIDLLYPIANLTGKRLDIFKKSILSVDTSLFRICIADAGSFPSIPLDTSNIFNYGWYPEEGLFNKSKLINLGVKNLIRSNTFIVCDADIIFIYQQENMIIDAGGYFLSKPKILCDFKEDWIIEHSYGIGKCFITNQNTFKVIGGFDENYIGYGYEDIDFAASYYLLKKKPYSFINTLTMHLDYQQENSTDMYKENNDRNKYYFDMKFKNYKPFLETIYSGIRNRKNDTNSWAMRP